MSKQLINVVYIATMVLVIIAVDFAFLRGRFWPRLLVNVGIVLIFLTIYFEFLKRP
jgi:hypothetical protein